MIMNEHYHYAITKNRYFQRDYYVRVHDIR